MAPTEGPPPPLSLSMDENSELPPTELRSAASTGGGEAVASISDERVVTHSINEGASSVSLNNITTADATGSNTATSFEGNSHDCLTVGVSQTVTLPGAYADDATSTSTRLKAKASVRSDLRTSEDVIQKKIDGQDNTNVAGATSVTTGSESQDSKSAAIKSAEAGECVRQGFQNGDTHPMTGGGGFKSSVTRRTLTDFEEQVLAKLNPPEQILGPAENNDVRVTVRRMPRDLQDFQDDVLAKVQSSNANVERSAMFSDIETNVRDGLLPDFCVRDESMDKSNLVVAVAVPNEDNYFLPCVVEFDPDAKAPVYRSRRFRLYAVLAMVVAIAGTVGAVTGMLLVSRNTSLQPAPLPDRATVGIREYVERLVGPNEPLNDPINPYRKALDWIQDVDPMALTPQSQKFTQRFLAAYFYFGTTMNKDWSNACIPSEEERLSNNNCMYEYIGVTNTELHYNAPSAKRWLSSDDECLWAGVECDASGQIVKLDFSGSSMTGSFPDGIAALPFLQFLSLSHGELEGTLPTFIGSMKHLMNLEIAGNRFSGSIPDSWFHSRSLIQFNSGANNLTGSISNTIGHWSKSMGYLSIYDNAFTGSLPEEMGSLTSLKKLAINGNLFAGSLPTRLAPDCRHLQTLELQRNKLSGSLPSEIGALTALHYLYLQSNLFNGTLPSGFSNLSLLWKFDASNNQFSGSIQSLVNFTQITKLLIENNRLTGSLPTEMGGLIEMIEFTASGNNFNGTVPQSLCNRVPSKSRLGSEQVLGKFQLDCAVPSSGEALAEVNCNCCTHCCDADGTDCQPAV